MLTQVLELLHGLKWASLGQTGFNGTDTTANVSFGLIQIEFRKMLGLHNLKMRWVKMVSFYKYKISHKVSNACTFRGPSVKAKERP